MNQAIYNQVDGESLAEAVIRAVSTETGSDPCRGRPIEESVDSEALDRLFAGRGAGRVLFRHGDVAVDVDSGGEIRVEPVS